MKRKICVILEIISIIVLIYCVFSNSQNIWLYLLLYIGIKVYIRMQNVHVSNIDVEVANTIVEKDSIYKCKNFLTAYELTFYKKLLDLEGYGYIIIPQVNLAAIIEKENFKYRNELFRNIDFGIFDKDFNLKILIELNDRTHLQYVRRQRDLKVRKILKICNIKLLNFYTDYSNEQSYVINRILKEINEVNDINN